MSPLAQGVGIASSILLVQSAPESPAAWLNYGVAGLVVISLVFGWLVPGRSHDREVARADRLEAELRRRDEYIAEQVVPALTRATDALAKVADGKAA